MAVKKKILVLVMKIQKQFKKKTYSYTKYFPGTIDFLLSAVSFWLGIYYLIPEIHSGK